MSTGLDIGALGSARYCLTTVGQLSFQAKSCAPFPSLLPLSGILLFILLLKTERVVVGAVLWLIWVQRLSLGVMA